VFIERAPSKGFLLAPEERNVRQCRVRSRATSHSAGAPDFSSLGVYKHWLLRSQSVIWLRLKAALLTGDTANVACFHYSSLYEFMRRLSVKPLIGTGNKLTYRAAGPSTNNQSAPISFRSQALMKVHSRITVPGETRSAAAVSSMLIPPKKRSSTMRLLRGSISSK